MNYEDFIKDQIQIQSYLSSISEQISKNISQRCSEGEFKDILQLGKAAPRPTPSSSPHTSTREARFFLIILVTIKRMSRKI